MSFLKDVDLIAGETISIDGTKSKAHKSKKANFNQKKIDRHLAYIEKKTQTPSLFVTIVTCSAKQMGYLYRCDLGHRKILSKSNFLKIINQMKNHFLIALLVFVGSIFLTPVMAQSALVTSVENAVKKTGKYAILVPNARYFQAAVHTGQTLKANNPKIDFQIVLISSVVKDLATDESLKPFIEMSEKAGISLVVCEFAMHHLEVKKSDYHSSIHTTPDGFAYMFGLQEMGFKTISL